MCENCRDAIVKNANDMVIIKETICVFRVVTTA